MKYKIFLLVLSSLAILSCSEQKAHTPAPSTEKQVIILKLDDVVSVESEDGLPVSPRWQRVIDYLREANIKASCGIIGYSLEEDNEDYFSWIKNVHNTGMIEFWHHGYHQKKSSDEPGEFESESMQDQRAALEQTQMLAKEKLGITFQVFGAHWSGTNETTVKAMETLPEIKQIFYSPEDSSRFVFERVMTLEDPVHVPDYEKFVDTYNRLAKNKPYLALQGHPVSWNDERWENFVKIIEFLQSQDVVFMTASEYAASK